MQVYLNDKDGVFPGSCDADLDGTAGTESKIYPVYVVADAFSNRLLISAPLRNWTLNNRVSYGINANMCADLG